MPSVLIDGVEYTPADDSALHIGVGITTHNRYESFKKTYKAVTELTPNATVVVVDDASKTPVPEATFRFDRNAGISRAKNKCLELLDGLDHIFLLDDDVFPVEDNWWEPYVNSPMAHLAYNFEDTGKRGANKLDPFYVDSEHKYFPAERGPVIYIHRSAIRTVGGFDTEYRNGYEHLDFGWRVYKAGLAGTPFVDVVKSEGLFYSGDRDGSTESSIPERERSRNHGYNMDRFRDLVSGKREPNFIEYRTRDNAVLTHYYTGQTDHNKARHLSKPDTSIISKLTSSIKGARTVLFHNEITDYPDAELVHTDPSMKICWQRWFDSYDWLEKHPEVNFAWCVDATDVEMLRAPWDAMRPGVIYCGWENDVVSKEWMKKYHTAATYGRLWENHSTKPLLNAGVIGADRETLMSFIRDLKNVYTDYQVSRHIGVHGGDIGPGDMAAFNLVAYEFGYALETGPQVTTVFKAQEKNSLSWWKHK